MSYATVSLRSSEPVVSVVIPTYNRLSFLKDAIASVMAQTYNNWELVIVDDGSTDGTKENLQYCDDKRIKVFCVAHCGNIAALRNAGVAASTGEWVAFLDSDDVWLPEKLVKQLAILEHSKGLWCYSGFEMMNEAGANIAPRSFRFSALNGWITKALLINTTSVLISSLLLQRQLFDTIGGFDENPALILREDYELALRLSMKSKAIALPLQLVRVREHTGRSTNAVTDGHKRTAFMYGYFAGSCSNKQLCKTAKSRQAYHLTEMAVKDTVKKKPLQALRQIGNAFLKGDTIKHIVSALRRSGNSKKETA